MRRTTECATPPRRSGPLARRRAARPRRRGRGRAARSCSRRCPSRAAPPAGFADRVLVRAGFQAAAARADLFAWRPLRIVLARWPSPRPASARSGCRRCCAFPGGAVERRRRGAGNGVGADRRHPVAGHGPAAVGFAGDDRPCPGPAARRAAGDGGPGAAPCSFRAWRSVFSATKLLVRGIWTYVDPI